MNASEMKRFLRISLSLSAERDRESLLSAILDTAMDVSGCDAGTLYLLGDSGLEFCRMVTRSMNIRQGGHDSPITLPPVPLDPIYVCSWVAMHNEAINVADVRTDSHFDFTGSLRYDKMTGYHTKSMLVVPLASDTGEVIGVMQLINALSDTGEAVPFPAEKELLVSALSSQAAISVTNMRYSEQITQLLDSLVGALSAAIDERTPYNANHTRNMVLYGTRFLDRLPKDNGIFSFDKDARRTFILAVWLHDVGKLVVPLEVMDKKDRLGERRFDVLARFREAELLERIAMLEGRMDRDEYEKRSADRAAAAELIDEVNEAGFLPDETFEKVKALAALCYEDEHGERHSLLTAEEMTCLCVRKGTLTDEERSVMESHVTVTAHILQQVHFPKNFSRVPEWAASHHELLNGSGYPKHLTAEDIPPEVRLLTILDVFDALTARDRPYKPAMPVEKALGILRSMVSEGSVDGDILTLFENSRAWEE